MIVPMFSTISPEPINTLFCTDREARLWIAECIIYTYLELSLEIMSPEELVRRDTANCLTLAIDEDGDTVVKFDNRPTAIARKLRSTELCCLWPSIEYRIGKETGLLRKTLGTALAETGLTLRSFLRQSAEVA